MKMKFGINYENSDRSISGGNMKKHHLIWLVAVNRIVIFCCACSDKPAPVPGTIRISKIRMAFVRYVARP